MFERTTREWAMSPMIETFTPCRRPRRSRIVKASRRACVGCSCAPSPALMIAAGKRSASIFGAPAYLWRITIMSGRIAIKFSAVSMSVSPFSTADPDAVKFNVSAERRFSAISNETRVRVDGSMKRLMTSCPRSAGTFFTGRSLTSLKPSAVSRINVISSGVSGSMPRRCLVRSEEVAARIVYRVIPNAATNPLRSRVYSCREIPRFARMTCGSLPHLRSLLHDQNFVLVIGLGEFHFDHFVRVGRHGLADDVRVNRQLAMSAIDEHGEHHFARTSEVDQRIERGAHGAAGVENVVDEHDDLVVDRLRQLRRLHHRLRRDRREVVAIERDVEDAERHLLPFHIGDLFRHSFADGNSPTTNADDEQIFEAAILLDDFNRHATDRAIHARIIKQTFLDVQESRRRIAERTED